MRNSACTNIGLLLCMNFCLQNDIRKRTFRILFESHSASNFRCYYGVIGSQARLSHLCKVLNCPCDVWFHEFVSFFDKETSIEIFIPGSTLLQNKRESSCKRWNWSITFYISSYSSSKDYFCLQNNNIEYSYLLWDYCNFYRLHLNIWISNNTPNSLNMFINKYGIKNIIKKNLP